MAHAAEGRCARECVPGRGRVLRPHLLHEQLGPRHEVTEGLIIDGALLHGFAHGHYERPSGAELGGLVEEHHGLVRDGLELGVRLLVRVHEVLDLRHAGKSRRSGGGGVGVRMGEGKGDLGWRARDAPELAHAEETTPRSNFVTEAETNLVMRGGIHVVVSRRP